ncbi:redox-sensitive bicupin YhaK (pirin superfamily) [Amycolatopsis lexingtonensis]|uniref:Redox-sensitive bicupin YhaK (Pirin superfamily) n=1 Tax=Amycolatopsis lexingtonensis TaxID=218822 RepID=A0ABR9HZS1_9PSEU|nr:pirin family protein [Amycolatopsis lexingtonensis]MBE1496441.1 redox-sensitive bicupin YhaK (pirin superfamily) [Amycolatopsis lexingtonensis]
MSNTEATPAELACADRPTATDPDRPAVEILAPREVPLGGPRAMRVRRTLPQRARSLIGAWCFADHYGPDEVASMDVAPHPHTGLQTVSWLFAGEIEHRDSLGTHAMVRPGELNLMTGGHGICHSEVSTPATKTLHGVQLWVALPERHRNTARAFDHYVPSVNRIEGAEIRVFLGSLAGRTSPIPTFTPLLGAEIVLNPDAHMSLGVDPRFEHGVLVDTGDVEVAGSRVRAAELGYVGIGVRSLTLSNRGSVPARFLLLGGTPFEEEILMWWNFVGRTHEEIAAFREAWEAGSDQFGSVTGYPGERLPAPALPAVRIKPRRNPASGQETAHG